MSDPMYALNKLPLDLIEVILPFLPAKSLGRFKSVSKRWYSLISSPNFIKNHIRNYTKYYPNSDPTHMIIVPSDGDFLYSVGIKQLNTQTSPATLTAKRLNLQEPWLGILGSCNGLVLAIDIHDKLCLINPTTRETLKVPDSGGESHASYGFGYDSSKDDYKLISISHWSVSDSDHECNIVRVYSLRNNSWNTFTNFPYQQHNQYSQCPGVLLNENLHWVVTMRRSKMSIATFSLADEQFREFRLPDSFNPDVYYSQVFALGGKLVLCSLLRGPDNFHEVWVMEEYGVPKSWTKLCIFESLRIDLDFGFIAQFSNWDIFLSNNDGNEFFIYNMDERRCSSVTIEECPEVFVYGTYVESLESLKRFR